MADGVWDHVGVGECEDALLELVRAPRARRAARRRAELPVVEGRRAPGGGRARAGRRERTGRTTRWASSPTSQRLPIPDYELFDTQRITDQKHGWFGLLSSRGCPVPLHATA